MSSAAVLSTSTAAFLGAVSVPVAPAFSAEDLAISSSSSDLSPFVGKAGFFMRVPAKWVRAMDRSGDGPAGAGGETLALVGNFKDIDTVSVRREPMRSHLDFRAKLVEKASGDSSGSINPRAIAEVLTSAERAAVEANQNFGVVAGVEGGKSGVMDFRLGEATSFEAPGSSPGSSNTYFAYDFYTEVCRASIEEITGGEKQCVGPRGDVLDTVRRRNFTVAVESDGYLYLVKASALESRWDEVGGFLMEIARSFRVPQRQ